MRKLISTRRDSVEIEDAIQHRSPHGPSADRQMIGRGNGSLRQLLACADRER